MDEWLKKYRDKFGDGFPTFQLLGYSDEEIIEIIKDCINKNKNAYELGYVTDENDIAY